jgi:hypothetical protein
MRKELEQLYKINSIFTFRKNAQLSDHCHVGRTEIMKNFNLFPEIKHDFTTMTTDTMRFTRSDTKGEWLLTVNGFFKFINEDTPYSFIRTFLIKFGVSRETRAVGTLSMCYKYEIVNEIFSFQPVTDIKVFTQEQATDADIAYAYDGKFTSERENEGKLEMLQQISGLKRVWCER